MIRLRLISIHFDYVKSFKPVMLNFDAKLLSRFQVKKPLKMFNKNRGI